MTQDQAPELAALVAHRHPRFAWSVMWFERGPAEFDREPCFGLRCTHSEKLGRQLFFRETDEVSVYDAVAQSSDELVAALPLTPPENTY